MSFIGDDITNVSETFTENKNLSAVSQEGDAYNSGGGALSITEIDGGAFDLAKKAVQDQTYLLRQLSNDNRAQNSNLLSRSFDIFNKISEDQSEISRQIGNANKDFLSYGDTSQRRVFDFANNTQAGLKNAYGDGIDFARDALRIATDSNNKALSGAIGYTKSESANISENLTKMIVPIVALIAISYIFK